MKGEMTATILLTSLQNILSLWIQTVYIETFILQLKQEESLRNSLLTLCCNNRLL